MLAEWVEQLDIKQKHDISLPVFCVSELSYTLEVYMPKIICFGI